MRDVTALHPRARGGPELEHAVHAFLHGYERIQSDGTRRVYGGTLRAVTDRFGPDMPVAAFDDPATGEGFRAWFRDRYGTVKPATYNRHLATCQSAFGWWRLQGWTTGDPTAGLTRPRVPVARDRARPRDVIERVLNMPDVPLRDRTLWRMLYETAARAEEILTLDVEDLDLVNKTAVVQAKGGGTREVFWQTGTARLLPRLLAGRARGPVFLSTQPPRVPAAAADMCRVTGRARLSYRRAAETFKARTGLTLHQLRHSALTHDAEDGTGTPMLRARSGHTSLRSLERYVNPSAEAVAQHVAARDPAARRRR